MKDITYAKDTVSVTISIISSKLQMCRKQYERHNATFTDNVLHNVPKCVMLTVLATRRKQCI